VLSYVIQGFGYGFAAAAQPGPFQTYVISQTLTKGWRGTLPAALAPLVSDAPIIALVLLVLNHLPDALHRFLSIASGLFILYLAWNARATWRNYDSAAPVAAGASQRSFFRAAVMNALSPGPYIYWGLVTGPVLVAGWREAPANGVGFLFGFYLAFALTLAGLVLLFGTARQLGPKVNRALLGVSAVALLGFGLYQLWLGVSGWAA
jgi:threonine/homoserine/homoserine lactone efflux protein